DKVLSHSNDLLSMITGILYVTNIEANEIRRESLRFSLCDFLAELKAVFAMRREQHLSLTWDYPVDLPMVETDKDKLNQILQNLIHNAIKFTDSGQVTVFARIRERHAPQIIAADQELESGGTEKFVEFRVADTGGGI